jgi:CIC family chloride channel protein
LLTGAFVAFLPEIAGNGYEPLNILLDREYAIGFVALLLLGKMIAATASVSSDRA